MDAQPLDAPIKKKTPNGMFKCTISSKLFINEWAKVIYCMPIGLNGWALSEISCKLTRMEMQRMELE